MYVSVVLSRFTMWICYSEYQKITSRVLGHLRSVQTCFISNCTPVFQVYVLKRPHVDEFLKRMGELFECVLFTASLAKVGHPCGTVCAYFELLEITGRAVTYFIFNPPPPSL